MNITEATKRACEEPTLVDALNWIAVWESERVIQQAFKWKETGVRTASHGGAWDTCFGFCFKKVLESYPKNKDEVGGAFMQAVQKAYDHSEMHLKSARKSVRELEQWRIFAMESMSPEAVETTKARFNQYLSEKQE